MAPEETGTDNRMRARKNFCIVFLHFSTAENSDPEWRRGMTGTDYSDCKRRDPQRRKTRSAGKCGQIYDGAASRTPGPGGELYYIHKNLKFKRYFLNDVFCNCLLQVTHANS